MSKYYEYRDVESRQLRICQAWGLKDPVNGSTAMKQVEKAQEELIELFVALSKYEAFKKAASYLPEYADVYTQDINEAWAEVKDAIGDVQVCMQNVCDQLDIDLVQHCYGPAVDVISKRTGKMVKGKFVKDQ